MAHSEDQAFVGGLGIGFFIGIALMGVACICTRHVAPDQTTDHRPAILITPDSQLKVRDHSFPANRPGCVQCVPDNGVVLTVCGDFTIIEDTR